MKNENEKHSLLFLNPPTFLLFLWVISGAIVGPVRRGGGTGMGRPLLWMQGSRAVVVVAGRRVLQWGSGVKGKKTHLLCFLVSVSGAVGADAMGQVVGMVVG
jgi:hypothetical protein